MEGNASWFELICMIKCRLRWVGHAASKGNRGGVNRVLWENFGGRDHFTYFKYPGADGRIIL